MNDTPPAFLICGSPRTGTRYTATVLKAAGLNVAHEGWWRILKVWPEQNLDGDVSCLGTFDLAYGGRVLAQVRNPRKAIPSIYRDLVGYGWHSTIGYYHSVTPNCTGEPELDAARIWTSFTRTAVDRAQTWWKLEELNPVILTTLFDIPPANAEHALHTVPRNTNHRPKFQNIQYDWPNHGDIRVALKLGQKLGYDC